MNNTTNSPAAVVATTPVAATTITSNSIAASLEDSLPTNSSICKLSGSGNLSALKLQLQRNNNNIDILSEADNAGNTPLHHSVWSNQIPMIQYLLSKLSLNQINRTNNTISSALHFAVARALPEPIKLLIQAGASIYQPNQQKQSPQMLARDNKHKLFQTNHLIRKLLQLNDSNNNNNNRSGFISQTATFGHSTTNNIASAFSGKNIHSNTNNTNKSHHSHNNNNNTNNSNNSNNNNNNSNNSGSDNNNNNNNIGSSSLFDIKQLLRSDETFLNLNAIFEFLTTNYGNTNTANPTDDSDNSISNSSNTSSIARNMGTLQLKHLSLIFNNLLGYNLNRDELRNILLTLDIDGDGVVDIEDFYKSMLIRSNTTFDQKYSFDKVWNVLDNDRNGLLTESDYRLINKKLGKLFGADNEQEIQTIFKGAMEKFSNNSNSNNNNTIANNINNDNTDNISVSAPAPIPHPHHSHSHSSINFKKVQLGIDKEMFKQIITAGSGTANNIDTQSGNKSNNHNSINNTDNDSTADSKSKKIHRERQSITVTAAAPISPIIANTGGLSIRDSRQATHTSLYLDSQPFASTILLQPSNNSTAAAAGAAAIGTATAPIDSSIVVSSSNPILITSSIDNNTNTITNTNSLSIPASAALTVQLSVNQLKSAAASLDINKPFSFTNIKQAAATTNNTIKESASIAVDRVIVPTTKTTRRIPVTNNGNNKNRNKL